VGTNSGTNTPKLILAFRNFANAPKNLQIGAMCGLSVLPDFVTSSIVLFFPFRFARYQAKSSKSQTHIL